ncbi:MAG: ABC transporter permease [Chloroflexota bacterium]
MATWSTIQSIISKEMTDNLRDRRSLFNAGMMIFFVPILYIFMFGALSAFVTSTESSVLDVPIQGAENAPNLIQFLIDSDLNPVEPPADPITAVREREVDLVLIIPDSFPADFSAGRPAEIQLLIDESSQNNLITASRVQQALQIYGARITNLRLLARGVSLETLQPLDIQTLDVSSRTERGFSFGSSVLALLPAIMLAVAMMSGLYMASDMTAGERERDSLEPLFMKPVPRWAIFTGKALTVYFFTQLGVIISSAVYVIILSLPFIEEITGIQINLQPGALLVANLLLIPINILAVGLQMLISAFVKSTREAQTYAQIVGLIGYLPSLFISFLPITQQTWMLFIPTISQYFLITEYMRSEPLLPLDTTIATGVSLLLALVLYLGALRLYYQERILLNR